MFYTDYTDPDSHPFVRKCWDMSISELESYADSLIAKFNKMYEEAFEIGMDSPEWTAAEEAEEKSNVANEVLYHRYDLQDRFGDVAPTDGQL